MNQDAGGNPAIRFDVDGNAIDVHDGQIHHSATPTTSTAPAMAADQRANRQRRGSRGGRRTGFDKTIYRHRNEVERTINGLKNFRAIATRYDKRAYVFHGTVTLAATRLWLRP